MTEIEYLVTDQRGLDSISFLWEKLTDHHRARSLHFAEQFAGMTWEMRRQELGGKIRGGFMRVDIARDAGTQKLIGYCVSSISEDKHGEIDSIFVEKDYRKLGIGGAFMEKALKWMDGRSVTRRTIAVAAGNEEVFPFYARYGFYPRATILNRPELD